MAIYISIGMNFHVGRRYYKMIPHGKGNGKKWTTRSDEIQQRSTYYEHCCWKIRTGRQQRRICALLSPPRFITLFIVSFFFFFFEQSNRMCYMLSWKVVGWVYTYLNPLPVQVLAAIPAFPSYSYSINLYMREGKKKIKPSGIRGMGWSEDMKKSGVHPRTFLFSLQHSSNIFSLLHKQ